MEHATQPIVTHFHIIRPRHEDSQKYAVGWLAAAHARAEFVKRAQQSGESLESALASAEFVAFEEQMNRVLMRLGGYPDRIARRGGEVTDMTHTRWDEMEIFPINTQAAGAGMAARTQYFAARVRTVFERFFAEVESAPADLIHVTCTGYTAPSGAQELVAQRGWHAQTTITHAYHMGCYAAVPALRMAAGFLASDELSKGQFSGAKNRVDVVHTEICTLHLNPLAHDLEQLVVQSLFADGFIKYSVVPAAGSGAALGLAIHNLQERIIPNTRDGMSWDCGDTGMRMGLSPRVPQAIAEHVSPFVDSLMRSPKISQTLRERKPIFAVHPGGPKIIEKVAQVLGLDDAQIRYSREALSRYGNMSSATLPHVWQAILEDSTVPDGTPIVSLAFGPGLTVCGAVLEKRVLQ